jgi:outer membrane protein TolC
MKFVALCGMVLSALLFFGTGTLFAEATSEEQYTKVPLQADTGGLKGSQKIRENETLNLGQCIEIALTYNPGIVAARNTIMVNDSRVGQAQSGYYPQVDLSGGYSRQTSFYGGGGFKGVSGTTTGGAVGTLSRGSNSYDQFTASASLSQNIYDFGKTSSQVSVQKFNLESSQSDFNATSDQVIFNVKQAYYGILQAKRNRDVAAEVVKQFQWHLDQAQGFYDAGTKPKIDVIKAQVDLSNAKLSLIKAENALKIARVTLNNALGVPDAPFFEVEDNLAFLKFPITFDEALKAAYENRPDLKSILAQKEAAKASIRLAQTGYYPVLTGNASYDYAGEEFPLSRSWNVGAVLTFPLFSGFLTKYQVREARANLSVLDANEESLRQQIMLDIRQSYLTLQDAEEAIPTAEVAVTQAKENLALANGRYEAGVGNPIEQADAVASFTSAEAAYINALYAYKIAQATIEKAMGVR